MTSAGPAVGNLKRVVLHIRFINNRQLQLQKKLRFDILPSKTKLLLV
jgi:hypothetical protein